MMLALLMASMCQCLLSPSMGRETAPLLVVTLTLDPIVPKNFPSRQTARPSGAGVPVMCLMLMSTAAEGTMGTQLLANLRIIPRSLRRRAQLHIVMHMTIQLVSSLAQGLIML